MRILITGANGQLGTELKKTKPENIKITSLDLPEFDISDSLNVKKIIKKTNPDVIINTAAYTNVEQAEDEYDKAFQINTKGVKYLAEAAKVSKALLIQISTDFIFDGRTYSPYEPAHPASPISVYGKTKLGGENAVKSILKDYLIIRTAWLYSCSGSNFVKTILNLSENNKKIHVIDDEFGTPTWAKNLADFIWKAVLKKVKGCLHFTDAGSASRYDFAHSIIEEAYLLGLIKKKIEVVPVDGAKYITKAKRPGFGILDKKKSWETLDYTPVHWRTGLKNMLLELKKDC